MLSWRPIAVVLLLLAGLLWYIYAVEVPQRYAFSNKGMVFAGVERDQIEQIEINNRFGTFTFTNTKVRLQNSTESVYAVDPRQLEHWRLKGLPNEVLGLEALGLMLRNVLQLQLNSPFKPDQPLEHYGLDKPQVKIVVSHGGKQTTVEIGKRSNYLEKQYLRINAGPQLAMASDDLLQATRMAPEDYRDYQPLRVDAAGLQAIQFAGTALQIDLRRTPDGSWQFVGEGREQEAAKAVQRLLELLNSIRIVKYLPLEQGTLQRYGLDAPELRMLLTAKTQTVPQLHELDFAGQFSASPDPPARTVYLYVHGRRSVYQVALRLPKELQKKISAGIDRTANN